MPAIPVVPWNDILVLFPTAITVFMLGSIESLLSASIADGMTGSTRHHSNQELIGQGIANLVVPFFAGIPVTGVIARTAVNIRAGARTRLSAIIHSLVLTCLIFFLGPVCRENSIVGPGSDPDAYRFEADRMGRDTPDMARLKSRKLCHFCHNRSIGRS